MLAVGANLGPYRLLDQLGRGGMAMVYRGYQPGLDRYVAIKILPGELKSDPDFRERFRLEARAVARLRNRAILTLYDFGEDDGTPYLVTELLQGGTLLERLGKPMDPATVRAILAPIAEALDYAHAQGILHRDVKPSNILFTADGQPVLGDFGLAKIIGTLPITHAGSIVGTPEYMAPELCSNEPAGPASDRYGLAVVAYQMLTGELPFEAETPMAVILSQIKDTPPPARTVNANVTPEAEAALTKALSKNPDERFKSAVETIEAITGEAVEPQAPSPISMWVTALLGVIVYLRFAWLLEYLTTQVVNFVNPLPPDAPPGAVNLYFVPPYFATLLVSQLLNVLLLCLAAVAMFGLMRQRPWAPCWATLALGVLTVPYVNAAAWNNIVVFFVPALSLLALRSVWHPGQAWQGIRAEWQNLRARAGELTGNAKPAAADWGMIGLLLAGLVLALVPPWNALCALHAFPSHMPLCPNPNPVDVVLNAIFLQQISVLAIPATVVAVLAAWRGTSWKAQAATVAAGSWLGGLWPLALPLTLIVFARAWRER